jgi:SAM-dependent methyltransferase
MESLQKEFYASYYSQIVKSSYNSLGHRLMHSLMEKNISKKYFGRVVELGVGDNQHLKFVKHKYNSFVGLDLRVAKELRGNFINADILNIPIKNKSVDRVIVTCLMHHLGNPVQALKEIKRIINEDANFNVTILVPCDPGFLYRIIRIKTQHTMKRLGIINPSLIHYLEHVGSYPAIDNMIRYVFEGHKVQKRNYPFLINSWNFNLFSIFSINSKNEE